MTAAEVGDAERIQAELRSRLDLTNVVDTSRSLLAAGLDVSYEVGTQRVAAAAALVRTDTLEIVETVVVHGEATFPYVPGLLAFREAPILLEALDKLAANPDVLVCDGYGIAHPADSGWPATSACSPACPPSASRRHRSRPPTRSRAAGAATGRR